jgi:hypothetical protein
MSQERQQRICERLVIAYSVTIADRRKRKSELTSEVVWIEPKFVNIIRRTICLSDSPCLIAESMVHSKKSNCGVLMVKTFGELTLGETYGLLIILAQPGFLGSARVHRGLDEVCDLLDSTVNRRYYSVNEPSALVSISSLPVSRKARTIGRERERQPGHGP